MRAVVSGAALALVLLVGCGGGPAPADDDPILPAARGAPAPTDHEHSRVGRPTLQLYAVLSADPAAMEGEAESRAMWAAVAGEGPRYGAVRRHVTWVPGGYTLGIDLDFADLPDPRVSTPAFAALGRQLAGDARATAEGARVAVFFRSDAGLLPGGAHVRLAGLAALYAADRWGGVVYDLLARRAYSAQQWHEELSRPALSAAHGRIQRRRAGPDEVWLLSRGEPKFGRPDLQLRGIVPGHLSAARSRFDAALAALRAHPDPVPGAVMRVGTETVTLVPCVAPRGLHDGDCVELPLR